MKMRPLTAVKDADQAREIAKEWQAWATDRPMSWSEVANWQGYLMTLAQRYDLTEEFEENGIL